MLLPSLNKILCAEYEPVASPGAVYETTIATCTFFTKAYGALLKVFGVDPTEIYYEAQAKCDTAVRSMF